MSGFLGDHLVSDLCSNLKESQNWKLFLNVFSRTKYVDLDNSLLQKLLQIIPQGFRFSPREFDTTF